MTANGGFDGAADLGFTQERQMMLAEHEDCLGDLQLSRGVDLSECHFMPLHGKRTVHTRFATIPLVTKGA